jgi:predicted component of type VI protein secretion system
MNLPPPRVSSLGLVTVWSVVGLTRGATVMTAVLAMKAEAAVTTGVEVSRGVTEVVVGREIVSLVTSASTMTVEQLVEAEVEVSVHHACRHGRKRCMRQFSTRSSGLGTATATATVVRIEMSILYMVTVDRFDSNVV